MPGANVLELLHRQTVRMDEDPNDKTTVISIFPLAIDEVKPTIQPGYFQLAPGSFEKPSTLVVGSSSWWKDPGPDEPLIEIPHRSITVAKSIVTDYCNGLLHVSMGTAQPGLFFAQGEFNSEQVKSKFKMELVRYKAMQETWYRALINLSDGLWARSGGNPLAVPDLAKLAVSELGLNRDWAKNFVESEPIEKCIACGSMKKVNFPVCPNCKAVTNQELATRLGLKFA